MDPPLRTASGLPVSPRRRASTSLAVSPGPRTSSGQRTSHSQTTSPSQTTTPSQMTSPSQRTSPGQAVSPGRRISPGQAVSPGRRSSPGTSSRPLSFLRPNSRDNLLYRRRRGAQVPDLEDIPLPDAMYLNKDKLSGGPEFVFANIPESETYGASNSTVHRLQFLPVDPIPQVLDINGTLSLPADLSNDVTYTLTSVMSGGDNRALYEIRVGPRPHINMALEVPIANTVDLREYNRIGLKMSRLITRYVFDAHATWRSLNYFRLMYLMITIGEPETVEDMIPRFRYLEDVLMSFLISTLSALSNFELCLKIIQEFNSFYRSYRRHLYGPRRHAKIMETMELDIEIFKASMNQAKENIQVAALRSRTHEIIRQGILKTLDTNLQPFQ